MKIINYVSVFIIFSGAFVIKGDPVDFYFYYILILFLLPLLAIISGFQFHKGFLATMSAFLLIGIVNVIFRNNSIALLLKQVIGISMIAVYFFYLLKANKFDYEKLFGIYMRMARFIAAFAILQVVAYLIGIRFLYDFSWIIPEHRVDTTGGFIRVSSILMEPSHFVTSMAPAIYISMHNLYKRSSLFIGRWSSLMILVSVLLTLSLIGYLTLILSFIFLFKNPFSFKKIIITASLFIVSMIFLYNNVQQVTSRVDGLVDLFIKKDIHRVNISAFTIFNNFTVASQNFIRHPLFGTGLGSHPYVFDTYAYKGVYDTKRLDVANSLNKDDANSLFLRLVSETGLFGLALVFFFVNRFRVKSEHIHELGWVISTSILILILIKLIREGHYFNNGLPFFLWTYYYVKVYPPAGEGPEPVTLAQNSNENTPD